jgi:hypothetical protein
MMRSLRLLIGIGGLISLTLPGLVWGAELNVPGSEARAADCGPCGCLQVTYDRHRVLEQTYGLGYDPRNFDTQEPYFYFGRMRAYPRYFIDGWVLAGRSC